MSTDSISTDLDFAMVEDDMHATTLRIKMEETNNWFYQYECKRYRNVGNMIYAKSWIRGELYSADLSRCIAVVFWVTMIWFQPRHVKYRMDSTARSLCNNFIVLYGYNFLKLNQHRQAWVNMNHITNNGEADEISARSLWMQNELTKYSWYYIPYGVCKGKVALLLKPHQTKIAAEIWNGNQITLADNSFICLLHTL